MNHAWSSNWNRLLIGPRCAKCGIQFETFQSNPDKYCLLCKYEKLKTQEKKDQMIASIKGVKSEQDLYNMVINKGIELFNKKIRTARSENCTLKNVSYSMRLFNYRNQLEKF